jgi:RND family efflux transporter MFP subunit
MTFTARELHVRNLTYAFIVVAAVTAAGCSHDAGDTPEVGHEAAVAVSTTRAAMVTLPSTFEAGGIVRSRLTAPVASRVMATVLDVKVRAGDRVRRGAPLIRLDAREPEANRNQATAAAAAAEQSATAAEADVVAAEASLTLARATHGRIADLAARRSATAQELDQAEAALASAEAQVRGARARQAASAAQRDAARAGLMAAAANLTYAQLSAPFDGVVTERSVDPGAMAAPGVPLLTVEDPAALRLEVKIDESRAAQVRVGDNVDVQAGDRNAAASDSWSAARVTEIARIDPASHAFVVKVDLPNDGRWLSGMFARARFAGPSRSALAVPENALIRRGQLTFVYVIDSGNVAHLRSVSPGAAGSGQVEVLAGLAEGDAVVITPPPALSDGRPVRPGSAVARSSGTMSGERR